MIKLFYVLLLCSVVRADSLPAGFPQDTPDPKVMFSECFSLFESGEVMKGVNRFSHSSEREKLQKMIERTGEEEFAKFFKEKKISLFGEVNEAVQNATPQYFIDSETKEKCVFFEFNPTLSGDYGVILHLDEREWKMKNSASVKSAELNQTQFRSLRKQKKRFQRNRLKLLKKNQPQMKLS